MMTDDLPLKGIRVLDLSRVLAGPWCAQVLGDLGADVLKVEHPERGDDTRDWGLRTGETNTTYFNAVNRNKSSIGIDLATPEGIAIVRDLTRDSDIVVQNFKTGGADKLGIGYAQLSAINPRLIYCSIAGYASDGPEATRPGYDLVVQGESGLMSLNGEAHQPPLKFGLAAVDLFTGQFAAQAVLAALYQRERSGKGRHVELALFDSGVALTSYYGLEALELQADPPRYGNNHPSIIPYGVYNAADGPLVITIGTNAQFLRFCEVIERPDLANDPLYATNLSRSKNRSTLLPMLEAAIAQHSRSNLLQRLRNAGIPCGEVLGLHEALRSKRAHTAALVVEKEHTAEAGSCRAIAPPYRMDGKRLPLRHMPPALAADSRAVLTGRLGYDESKLADLIEKKIVR